MRKISIRFKYENDLNEFSNIIGIRLTNKVSVLYWNSKTLKHKKPIISIKNKPKDFWWKSHWVGMPEFIQEKYEPFTKIDIMFNDDVEVKSFANILEYKISEKCTSLWFPMIEYAEYKDFKYVNKFGSTTQPKYNIYIPSKGRWDLNITHKALKKLNIKHKIVVEDIEYDNYVKEVGEEYVLRLPFSNLNKGSIPVRNWIWEHSIKNNEEKHWIIDDNIYTFYRLNKNTKIGILDGSFFSICEEFTDRYSNVAFSGLNNIAFAPSSEALTPIQLNTRIYSCTLINNDIKYRWRGLYNEDTDICLRALKDGWNTIQFNNFLIDKATTMKMKGGNTDNVYNDGSNRLKFAKSLKQQHPDCTKIVWKFNRWHHSVDYSRFKQKLSLIDKNKKYKESNDMILKNIKTNNIIELKAKQTDNTPKYIKDSAKKLKQFFC